MRAVTGGTDTHLALIDLQGIGVTGAEAEARCDAARIMLNKNAIPYDPQPPAMASGIRVGTPGRHHPGHGRGRHGGSRLAHRPCGARRRRLATAADDRRRGPRTLVARQPGVRLLGLTGACASTCCACWSLRR